MAKPYFTLMDEYTKIDTKDIKISTSNINSYYDEVYRNMLTRNYNNQIYVTTDFGFEPFSQHGTIKKIKKQQNIMTRLSNTLKRILSPNHKLLHKAGFLDSELDITEEGRIALTSIVLQKYEEELVVLAKEKIEEEKDLK